MTEEFGYTNKKETTTKIYFKCNTSNSPQGSPSTMKNKHTSPIQTSKCYLLINAHIVLLPVVQQLPLLHYTLSLKAQFLSNFTLSKEGPGVDPKSSMRYANEPSNLALGAYVFHPQLLLISVALG